MLETKTSNLREDGRAKARPEQSDESEDRDNDNGREVNTSGWSLPTDDDVTLIRPIRFVKIMGNLLYMWKMYEVVFY